MQPMSIAKMISLNGTTPVTLPTEFVEMLTGEAKFAVLIFRPYSPVIRLIPIQHPIGMKVVIKASELSSALCLEIQQIFARNKFKSLYCTGLCITQKRCIYEGYFDFHEPSISEVQLKEKITQLKGVENVEFFKIQD